MANGEDIKYSVACPACPSRFKVAASKIAPQGSKFRCPKCGSPFITTIREGQAVTAPVQEAVAPPSPPPVTQPPAITSPPPAAEPQSVKIEITTNVEKSKTVATEPVAPAEQAPAAPAVAAAARAAPTPLIQSADAIQWRLDVPEYAEYTFTLGEIRNLVRDGGLFPGDRVMKVGNADWVEAEQIAEFRRFFELKEMLVKKKAEAPKISVGAPVSSQSPCANHPQWEADYKCTKCGHYLCIHCVVEKQAGTNRYMACKSCQDLCKKVDKTYAIVPFYRMLPQLFTAPLQGWGPFMILINALLVLLSKLGKISLYPVVFGVFYLMSLAYLLWIVKYAARGRETVPDWPDTSDIFELTRIGGRASLATFISFLPLIAFASLYLFTPVLNFMKPAILKESMIASQLVNQQQPEQYPSTSQIMENARPPSPDAESGAVPDTSFVEQMAVQQGGGSVEDMSPDARRKFQEKIAIQNKAHEEIARRQAVQSSEFLQKQIIFVIIAILLGVIGCIYYPMALAVTAVWNVIRPLWNPPFIFKLIRRIALDYVIFLAFLAIFSGIGWLATTFIGLIPYVGGIIGSFVAMYFYFVISFMLGRLCYSNDQKLEWEEEIYPGTAHGCGG